jgi:hypothetical protein
MDGMNDPLVMQTVTLGAQWPTVDPFLFCAHHRDLYPAGTDQFSPVADLRGRELGADFSGRDGWSLYHGHPVPGFPQHPHRGFETITYVRRGVIDHSDSLGARARFGDGDTQWLTAGRGIVHAEMFPLLRRDEPNHVELFQIWLNLPAASKMAEPSFMMQWSDDLVRIDDDDATVAVVVGQFGDRAASASPPDSWAADPGHDVAIWHVVLQPGGSVVLPPARTADAVRVAYVFMGSGLQIGEEPIGESTGAQLAANRPAVLRAGSSVVEILVLQGVPIGEPVARYGPFVMNTEADIRAAFSDYQQTGFGGWPWPEDGPVHGADPARFAVHPNGYRQQPADVVQPHPR